MRRSRLTWSITATLLVLAAADARAGSTGVSARADARAVTAATLLAATEVASPAAESRFDVAGTLWATGAAILIGGPGVLFFLLSGFGYDAPLYAWLALPGFAPWGAHLIADLVRGRFEGNVAFMSLLGAGLGLAAGYGLLWLIRVPFIIPMVATVLLPLIGSVALHEWIRGERLAQQLLLVAMPFLDPLGAARRSQGLTLAMEF